MSFKIFRSQPLIHPHRESADSSRLLLPPRHKVSNGILLCFEALADTFLVMLQAILSEYGSAECHQGSKGQFPQSSFEEVAMVAMVAQGTAEVNAEVRAYKQSVIQRLSLSTMQHRSWMIGALTLLYGDGLRSSCPDSCSPNRRKQHG